MPIWFHWSGSELVFGSPANAPKTRALRDNTQVAVTIDKAGDATHFLMIRGPGTVAIQDGVIREYAAAARRYLGEEAGERWVRDMDQPGMKMARIAVRPAWVGIIDFQERFPSAMGKTGRKAPRKRGKPY